MDDGSNKHQARTERIENSCQKVYSVFQMRALRARIFKYRKSNYPSICALAEIIFSIGPSNSTVECGFSHLTTMLTDKRLNLSHATMKSLKMIKVNQYVLSADEIDVILQEAVEGHLCRKRKTILSESDK